VESKFEDSVFLKKLGYVTVKDSVKYVVEWSNEELRPFNRKGKRGNMT
jgi:hypothetical protein